MILGIWVGGTIVCFCQYLMYVGIDSKASAGVIILCSIFWPIILVGEVFSEERKWVG